MNLLFPRGKESFEIKKISVDGILSVFEYQKKGEIYMAMLELAKDCIVNINGSNPTLEQLRKLPLVNIEFAIVEAFKLYGLPSLLEGIYTCPRMNCGTKIIKEVDESGFDNRIDISNKEVNFSEDMNPYILSFSNDFKIVKNELEIDIKEIHFRDITIQDLIEISSQKGSSIKNLIKSVMQKTIVNIVFDSNSPEINFHKLMNRYLIEVLDFPNYQYIENAMLLFRTYGMDLKENSTCPKCNKKWKQTIDFTSFFVYALSLMSEGKGN